MKVVAVKDHSVPFQVEIPLAVEKSVAARAWKLRNSPTTTPGYNIMNQYPKFQ